MISAVALLEAILRTKPGNTYKPPVKPAQPMHLVHIIACSESKQRLSLSLILPLPPNGQKPLLQTVVAYEVLLSLTDCGFQRGTDECFFLQEPG